MAAAVEKQWGTTPPISTTLPTPQELAANDALIAELKEQNNFESPEETERRYTWLFGLYDHEVDRGCRKSTLQLIQKVTTEFVRHVSKQKNLPQSTIDGAGGKIVSTVRRQLVYRG